MSSGVSACPACGTKNRVPVSAQGRPQCASCHGPLPWLVDAEDDTLGAALNTGQLVLIDLWAPWCGPCRMVAPILERLSVCYAGKIKVVKVNVDHNPRAAARFEAQSIPTLAMVRDGRTLDRIVGAQPEAVLAQRIDALLAG
jgi:thioredoxin 2